MRRILLAISIISSLSFAANAQEACPYRGQLDNAYCDANRDLVADAPTDASKLKDPSTLVFSFTPVEDPGVYKEVFQPFTEHLNACTGKKVVYYPVQSNAAQIEAMRAGRLHITGYAAGVVGFAVNLAGAVPFGTIGKENERVGYHVLGIVKADSPYKQISELKGKRVAHTAPSSNSGNLAPRVYFPENGLTPDTDYKVLMSGGHDKSVLGVNSGDYDMAAVASNVFERMAQRGVVKLENFRVIYKSPEFPSTGFAMVHDLKPELSAKIRECMYSYRFSEQMKKEFAGYDRIVPMNYQEHWKPLRDVAEKSGTPYNKTAYEAEAKREAEEAVKKAAAAKAVPATPPAAIPNPATHAPAKAN